MSLYVLFPLAFVLSILVSAFACWLVMKGGILDHPDSDRKAHDVSVPSSGGIGIIVGTVLAFSSIQIFHPLLDQDLIALAAATILALGLGFVDDRTALDAKLKLVVQVVISLGLAGAGVRVETIEVGQRVLELGPVLGLVGSGLWIFVVMNAVNFMDGANGMAMGSGAFMALAFFGLALFGGTTGVALVCLVLFGALAGFLRWNLPGRLFAGDAGALSVGVLLAGSALIISKSDQVSLWTGPLILLPFLADVLLTLIWRARRGRRLFDAHSDHIYQIAMRIGLSHINISSVYWLFAFHTGLLAIATAVVGDRVPQIAFVASLAVFVLMFTRIRRAAAEFGFTNEAPDETKTPDPHKNLQDPQAPDDTLTRQGH